MLAYLVVNALSVSIWTYEITISFCEGVLSCIVILLQLSSNRFSFRDVPLLCTGLSSIWVDMIAVLQGWEATCAAMASVRADSLDDFLPYIQTSDTKKRLHTYEQLVGYLRCSYTSLESRNMEKVIDGLIAWISCSNFKVNHTFCYWSDPAVDVSSVFIEKYIVFPSLRLLPNAAM